MEDHVSSEGTGVQCGGTDTHHHVKDYYGKTLTKSSDLKTGTCTTPAMPMPDMFQKALEQVHPDVTERYYGCGLLTPECLDGCRVLDLGCGSGRDCYVLSQLVGEKGHVTGIDMTEEQLEVARKYLQYHTQTFGYSRPNVEFVLGCIENLQEAGLEESVYDLIISNCVLNLSPDKRTALKEAHRVLKDGGELYFSDIYSSRRLPEQMGAHTVLWGECLGGALWWEDLLQLAEEVGFSPPRLLTARPVTLHNNRVQSLLHGYEFVSATYRLFKIPHPPPYAASQVIYNGNITGSHRLLLFDASHAFKENEVSYADAELSSILRLSRYAEEFSFQPQQGDHVASCCTTPVSNPNNPFEFAGLQGGSPVSATGGCCGAQQSCCK